MQIADYIDNIKKIVAVNPKKINPVHEIVNVYLKFRGWDDFGTEEYKARNIDYPRLCKEAKALYTNCGEKLEDALWSLDALNYKASKGNFNWTIITCLKHPLK